MIQKPKSFIHWLWLIFTFSWTVFILDILTNIIANILISASMLKWIFEHVILVLTVLMVFALITLLIYFLYKKEVAPDHIRFFSWIKLLRQYFKYIVISAFLLTMLAAVLTPVSSPLAIIMLSFGVVAATLLLVLILIEFSALVRAPSPNTVENPPPPDPIPSTGKFFHEPASQAIGDTE